MSKGPASHSTRYTFGAFLLDPRERLLLRGGEQVDLPPKAFDVLVVLVANSGHLVTKNELLETVWSNAVVEESSLSASVSRARRALGETARDATYIETVPGSGYRFTSKIGTLPPADDDATVLRRTRRHIVIEEEETKTGPVPLALAGFMGASILILAALLWFQAPSSDPATDQPALAVVPPFPSDRVLGRAAYERGRAQWWKRRGIAKAKAQFRLALHHDSTLAEAYVGLAAAYAFSYGTGREAKPLLERAIALDSGLSMIYATRGFLRMMQDWDWGGAEADLRHALRLDPTDVSALQWMATLRMIQGRMSEADRLLRQALAVAPPEALPSLHADRAQAFYYSGRMDEAVAANRQARRLDPGFWMNDAFEEMALMLSDRPLDAAEVIADRLQPKNATAIHRAAEAGTTSLMRLLVNRWNPAETLTQPYLIARFRAALGENERALAHLAHAVKVRDFLVPFCNVDPVFEDLRIEPRFRALVGDIGLRESPTNRR